MIDTASNDYSKNLAALRDLQPDVAAIVDATPVPPSVKPATGRDGSNTFQIESGDGRMTWFGGSSMPTVSASEVFSGFVSDGRNVLLPGVLTGTEPLTIADKLPIHSAVFVVAEHPWHIKLALHLYEYADYIAAGRIVFILAHDIVASVCNLVGANPGYELPARLLTVPQRSQIEMATLQKQMESAGEAATAVYARVVEDCAERIRSRRFGVLPPQPRVAVLGMDARPDSFDQACRVARALRKLGWPHELCIPDAPSRCHMAARIQVIDRLSAELVLLINGGSSRLREVLPQELPVVSWYLPGTHIPVVSAEGLGLGDRVFVSYGSAVEVPSPATLDAEPVVRCEVGADDVTFRSLEQSNGVSLIQDVDVAILMDLPDDREEACDVSLASHKALWSSLRKLLLQNVDRYRHELAGELVDLAQRNSGVKLEDAAMRAHFVGLLRSRIAPAGLARADTKSTVSSGFRVGIWGANWHETGDSGQSWRGAIPRNEELNRLFQSVGVVLIPLCSAATIQMALDALAAGVRVLCRAPDDPFESAFPGLSSLAPHLHFYRTAHKLGIVIRRLISQEGAIAEEARAVQRLVRTEHCVSNRVCEIVDRVRRG
ncbi:MAG: hypothetical protein JSU63_05635 [Phycisphaerales bacterium]|nr:MAG: hypothetical protein JSU63_05635 [Phycisphaerales bacterium]